MIIWYWSQDTTISCSRHVPKKYPFEPFEALWFIPKQGTISAIEHAFVARLLQWVNLTWFEGDCEILWTNPIRRCFFMAATCEICSTVASGKKVWHHCFVTPWYIFPNFKSFQVISSPNPTPTAHFWHIWVWANEYACLAKRHQILAVAHCSPGGYLARCGMHRAGDVEIPLVTHFQVGMASTAKQTWLYTPYCSLISSSMMFASLLVHGYLSFDVGKTTYNIHNSRQYRDVYSQYTWFWVDTCQYRWHMSRVQKILSFWRR